MAAEGKKTGLSELLDLVRIDEVFLQSVSKKTLLDLAEFILNKRWQYTTKEHKDAVEILAKYHIAFLADLSHPRCCREIIEKERAKPYERRCGRCGLIITAEKSVQTGYGSVCRRKVGASVCHVAQSSDAGRELHVKFRKGDGGDG
jgi:Family of unknown function (DUF6011)